jgi:hypothetical protein
MAMMLTNILLGVLVGSWVLPVIIEVRAQGWGSLSSIPTEGGFAQAPTWLSPEARRWLPFAGGVLGLMLGGLFAVVGGKLIHHLLVYRLKWITEEQVRHFNARTPRF